MVAPTVGTNTFSTFMSTVPQAPAPMIGFPVAATSVWQQQALPTPYDDHTDEHDVTHMQANRGAERVQQVRKHAPAGGNPGWDDTATTVMIRNLPNKYSQHMLLRTIGESGFQPCVDFDFFYLPMDRGNGANLGYGFLNFIEPLGAAAFAQAFQGRRMRRFNSRKTIDVMPALIQGYEANKLHYAGTRVVHAEDFQCRPLFLHESSHATVALEATKGISINRTDNQHNAPMTQGQLCDTFGGQQADDASMRRRRGGSKRRNGRGGGRDSDEVVSTEFENTSMPLHQPVPQHHPMMMMSQERFEFPSSYPMACRTPSKDSINGAYTSCSMGDYDSRLSSKDLPSQWSNTSTADQDVTPGLCRQLTPDSSLHTPEVHTPQQGASRRPSSDFVLSRRGSHDNTSRRPSFDGSHRGFDSRRGSFDFAMPYDGFHRCTTPEFSPLDERPSGHQVPPPSFTLPPAGVSLQTNPASMSVCAGWSAQTAMSPGGGLSCFNCGCGLQPHFQFCPSCSSPTKHSGMALMPASPYTASTANSPSPSAMDSSPSSSLQPR